MKLPFDKALLLVTLVFWGVMAWLVADYNLGLGQTTLRWPNPAHPTAAWHWDAAEATPTIIEPRTGQWLRVTLPRGFVSGTLTVNTNELAELTLKAEQQVSRPVIIQASQGRTHHLPLAFTNLAARGKTFRFRVENPSSSVVEISSIKLTTVR